MYKDYNDLLVADIDIRSLKTVPMDILVLEIELDGLHDKQAEYKKASLYCRSVRDDLVKSDIAELLSKRWGKSVEEVKSYLKVDPNTTDEIIAEVDDVDSAFRKLDEYILSGFSNLGFKSIDESLGGVKDTDVIGLGGYSGHGKSMFSVKIATYRMVRERDNVLFFTMEMSAAQVLGYICQELLHIGEKAFFEYVKTAEGSTIYAKVKDALKDRLRIVEKTGKTMKDVWKITEALNNSGFKVGFVVFDNFQLIPGVSEFGPYEEQAKLMKSFSNYFHAPLLMLSQLNDGFQQKGSKELRPPAPADLKGSNAFMSALDELLLIWRPALMQFNNDSIKQEEQKNTTFVKIGKRRRDFPGPTMFRYEYERETYSLHEVPLGGM